MNIAKAKEEKPDGGVWYVYDYCCEGCGSMGHLEVPDTLRRLDCPENCGASYVQWHPPEHIAALMCVVCPVLETKAFETERNYHDRTYGVGLAEEKKEVTHGI
jgi:hypothetical protein